MKDKRNVFMKLSILFIIFFLVLNPLLSGYTSTFAESIHQEPNIFEDNTLQEVLVTYFASREADYYSKNPAKITDNTHYTYIQKWLDSFLFSVTAADISFQIESLIEEKGESIKIKVYEWVSLHYYWLDEQRKQFDVMGFGAHHILEVSKYDYDIIYDSYIEATGYDHCRAEDVQYILQSNYKETNENFLVFEEPLIRANSNYSPTAAVSYSNIWCGQTTPGGSSSQNPANYNPEYYWYDNDCCNFVSQCLYAGGISESGNWWATRMTGNTGLLPDINYTYSGIAWRKTTYFRNYLIGVGYDVVTVTNLSQCTAGNPIYWLSEPHDHNMLIVGKTLNSVLVNGHNNDMYRYPFALSSHTFYTICMKHNYIVTSYTSTMHTLTCSTCGDSYSSSHKWKTVGGHKICSVCGYSQGGTQAVSHDED